MMAASSAAILSDDEQTWGHAIAAEISRKFKTAVHALPSKASNDFSRNTTEPNHLPNALQSAPLQRPQHAAESDVQQLEQSPQILKDRIRNAMRRRVGPNTGLTVKMVARATGLTERTIENASSGTIPRGDTLMALLNFFDATFANEIFAGATFMVVKLSDQRAADAARQINEGMAALAALQGRGR